MENEKKIIYEKRCKVGDPRGLTSHNVLAIIEENARITKGTEGSKLYLRTPGSDLFIWAGSILSLVLLEVKHLGELIVFTYDENFKSQVDELAAFIEKTRDAKMEIVPEIAPKKSFWRNFFRR